MPKDNITVELSRADRQLLRDVVDAIRSLKPEREVPESRTRLVEAANAGNRAYATGAHGIVARTGTGTKLPDGRIDLIWDL